MKKENKFILLIILGALGCTFIIFIGVIIGSALFGLEFSFIVFMPLAIIYVHFYWKVRNKFVDKWTKNKKK